jgi:hypothetical protein
MICSCLYCHGAGSTYERTVGPRKRCLPGVVMKDKDFVELGRKMKVGQQPKLLF